MLPKRHMLWLRLGFSWRWMAVGVGLVRRAEGAEAEEYGRLYINERLRSLAHRAVIYSVLFMQQNFGILQGP
jgi:hypothetical protein